MVAAKPATKHSKVPLGLRLKAWWEGYEIKVRPNGPSASDESVTLLTKRILDPRDLPAWDANRIDLVEQVWGRGCSSPGDPAYLRELVKPFALNEHSSVVEVGAGLGETVRQIATTFKCRVKGFEPNPLLAEAGMARSEEKRLASRAKVLHCDLSALPLEPESADCVLSREFLHLVADKRQVLASVAEGLRSPGQLLLTDYVRTSGSNVSSTIDAWVDFDPEAVHLWTVSQYETLFAQLGLEHRISEDISDQVRQRVVAGWEQFISSGHGSKGSAHSDAVMVREVELWTRRVAALQSGDLRAYRFFVLKRREGQRLANE